MSDAVYPSDPLGLLESVPELERFLSDRRVRGGIERGRPGDVYRALFWARLRGSFPKERDTLAMLLSKRRLFIAPMNGAPGMQTINGVGTRVYGQAELGEDGAYVGTYYFVFLFVPIFPIASYLMSMAGHDAYRFFGRAPFDTLHWLWNRAVVLGVLGSVLFGLGLSATSTRHGRITVVNGLPFGVTAWVCPDDEGSEGIGASRLIVPPNAHRSVEVAAGDCTFVAFGPGGDELSSGRVMVAGGSHHTVWNVLGVAPLYAEDVVYSTSGGDGGDEPEIYCGQDLIDVSRVDDFLVDPPTSVSLRHGRTARRTHFGLAAPDELDCILQRFLEEDPQVPALLDRITEAAGYDPAFSLPLTTELELFGYLPAALELSRRIRDHHGDGPRGIEIHLDYQHLMERAARAEALREEYDERRSRLDDGDSHYLYTRLLPRREQLAMWRGLVERFPEHPQIALAEASILCDDGDFETGALRYDEASRWEEAREVAQVIDRAVCLFAAERRMDALLLLEQRFASADAMWERFFLAGYHETLAREHWAREDLMDPPEPPSLMARLSDAEVSPSWRAVYAAAVRRTPTDADLASVTDPGMAALIAVYLQALHDPDAAFERLTHVPAHWRGYVPTSLDLMLLAEAERRAPGSSQPLWADGRLHGDTPTFLAFVSTGERTDAFEDLPRQARATGHFMRSRDPSLDPRARAAALEEAHRLDVLPSWLGVAEQGWPTP